MMFRPRHGATVRTIAAGSALAALLLACATGASDDVEVATSDSTSAAPDASTPVPVVMPPRPAATVDAASAPDASGCELPAIECNDRCVDPSSDAANCGACGKACVAGEVCSASSCGLPCPGTLTRCGGQCVDSKTDKSHCGGCGMACPAQTNACTAGTCTATATVRGYIDGRTIVVIQGSRLKWHHVRDAAPGRWDGENYECTINGVTWFPSWPNNGPNQSCNCDSSSIGVAPLAARASTATFTTIGARGSITLLEQPSAANGFSLKLAYDDPPGGADWYEARIVYATR